MGKKIDIAYGACGSDCTGPYYITLREPMTVGEFITEWLTNNPNEWGYFGIAKKGCIFGSPNCEYRRGAIQGEPLPKNYLDKRIIKAYGSGGWTRSDFEFEVE